MLLSSNNKYGRSSAILLKQTTLPGKSTCILLLFLFFFFSSLLKVPVLVRERLRGDVVRHILRLYLPPAILESIALMDVLRDARGQTVSNFFEER